MLCYPKIRSGCKKIVLELLRDQINSLRIINEKHDYAASEMHMYL